MLSPATQTVCSEVSRRRPTSFSFGMVSIDFITGKRSSRRLNLMGIEAEIEQWVDTITRNTPTALPGSSHINPMMLHS